MPDVGVDRGVESPKGDGQVPFRNPLRLTLIALGLGIAVEVLFYGRPVGVSFPVWATLVVGASIGVAWLEARPPSRGSVWLALPILVLASIPLIRREPLTVFLSLVLTLTFLAVWVRTFRAGGVLDFGWLDFAVAILWVPVESIIRPWEVLATSSRQAFGERAVHSRFFAVLRGLLLALPVLVVFGVLLTAADLVFADYAREALQWLNLERLADLARRGLLIVACTIFFLGALVAALRHPGERRLLGVDRPLVPRLLGFTETVIVLGAVDLLFASFVLVQVRYLFGGEANITAAGYTYSEYARRGFGELVAVAVLTLGMILLLEACTRRADGAQRGWFNGLSLGMVLLVGVILASAFMRLQLYEQAYGFTRLRAYTHIAIVWMSVAFLSFVILLFAGSLRALAPVGAGAAFGFVLTFALLNVDGFIVRHNAARAMGGARLDIPYLMTLSEDAIPAMVDLAEVGPSSAQAELLPLLACRQAELARRQANSGWPSYHLSIAAAENALAPLASRLEAFKVDTSGSPYRWTVKTAIGDKIPCFYPAMD